ncbi:uncharacterized protein CC84DRAFT_1255281 [Paraphaeosphaeria sporulosa]|uniref:Rhodopsin domain-containing protein n=1 Tax=Paraphaeosphaeria sporulosa TaxID=1460663 RepID=A0A177D1W3_9PLEO|nr:uncharacterized protein CC84DRAFT_1255281 [Paraphaeosphaeria sporulosa]OAG13182.1 hypothetical protein CC84DRAFT_1255281 [Paraphaeosphaeria sporulosa]
MSDGNITLPRDSSFLAEIWYGIGLTIITLRYIARIRSVGFRGFQGDDYIAIVSLALYTADAILVDIAYHKGTNVDIPSDVVDLLTDAEIKRVTEGSKAQIAAWYTYTGLIWCMKFMLLFFYRRITMATFQNRLVRWCFWMCGVTYIAVFLTITFGCHPTQMNWQVRPMPPRRCTFKPQNFYVGAILNVVTDVIILAIPVPMLWGLQIKLSKKIAIGLFICSGTFVIAAAIVRAALTLGNTPSGLNINRWGVRETIVGIITVNLPILRPMFRRNFWRGTGPIAESSSYARSRPTKSAYGHGTFELQSEPGSKRGAAASDVELVTVPRSSSRSSRRSSSLEKGSGEGSIQNGIVIVEQTYHVSSSPRNEDEELGNWEDENKDLGRRFRTDISSGPRP